MSALGQVEQPPVWSNYLNLNNDVKSYLQIPVGSVASDVILQGIIDMSCWWVQNYLGRPIAPTEFFRRFSGYTGLNGSTINLPYYPIVQMISVAEYWGLNAGQVQTDTCGLTNGSPQVTDANAVPPYIGATVTGAGIPANTTILSTIPGVGFTMSANFTGTTGNAALAIATKGYILQEMVPSNQGTPGQQMYTCDRINGTLIRSFQGMIQRPFFPGLRNVEVTWIAGFNPLPPDIKFATLQLIAHYWRQTQQASRTFPLPAGAREDEMMVQPYVGIPPEVERVLGLYSQIGLG